MTRKIKSLIFLAPAAASWVLACTLAVSVYAAQTKGISQEMLEFPVLEPPATVLHLVQNLMILVSFIMSIRWGWLELRTRRNGHGKKRRASDTLPGAKAHNPSSEYHELRRDHNKLEEGLKEHQRWARDRDQHFSEVLARIGQRTARIEGQLNRRPE